MANYTRFVWKVQRGGAEEWVVAMRNSLSGTYVQPHKPSAYRGWAGLPMMEVADPAELPSFPTKRQALRRARYLFGGK